MNGLVEHFGVHKIELIDECNSESSLGMHMMQETGQINLHKEPKIEDIE